MKKFCNILKYFCLIALSREMHEGAVLLNLRRRFEKEIIYVSVFVKLVSSR